MGRLRTLVTLKADMAWPVLPGQCGRSSTRLRKGAKWSTKKYERKKKGGGIVCLGHRARALFSSLESQRLGTIECVHHMDG